LANDAKTIFEGKDLYGNDAIFEDYIFSGLDVASFGLLNTLKLPKSIKKILNRASFFNTIGTFVRTYKTEEEKLCEGK